MTRAPKICSAPHCPNLEPCAEHAKVAWAGSTRRARLPRGWEKRRRFILQRDPICRDGRVCNHQALSTAVDHIVPGDDHSHRNLQGICTDCHREKTQQEAAQARQRRS